MKTIAAILMAMTLTACGHQPAKQLPPKIEIVESKVPVRVACIEKDKVPVKPAYQFGKGDKPDHKEKAALLTIDFEAAEKYGNDWEAAAAGCVKTDAPQ